MSSAALSKLFGPIKLGDILLQHRIAMAPMTRLRNDDTHTPLEIMAEHYAQRGSTPGTLLTTDATIIAPKAGGYDNIPEIYTDAQVRAWKRVVDAVHAKGSYIFLQLWALGRAARPQILEKEAKLAGLPADGYPYVSASNVRMTGKDQDPRPLTLSEIKEYVQYYAEAAQKAVVGAGFDGVEIHGANGYLIDQFIQDVSNKRTDEYGGSIENRSKFALEVIDAVVARIGAKRTAIRFSPFGRFQDMRMADPVPTYSYLLRELRLRHPHFAYVHFVEADAEDGDSLDFARKIWHSERPAGEHSVVLSCGNHTRESALKHAEKGDVVTFGRPFISNPDLVRRLRDNIALTPADPNTFYSKMDPKGYIDYPFADAMSSLSSRSVAQTVEAAVVEAVQA